MNELPEPRAGRAEARSQGRIASESDGHVGGAPSEKRNAGRSNSFTTANGRHGWESGGDPLLCSVPETRHGARWPVAQKHTAHDDAGTSASPARLSHVESAFRSESEAAGIVE